MALKYVIKEDDIVQNHTDIQGTPINGTVQTGSLNTKNINKGIATSDTIVNFPSHAHALNEGVPIDFREHSVKINATGKHNVNGFKIARDGDIVPVADEAGPDAVCVASTNNLRSN